MKEFKYKINGSLYKVVINNHESNVVELEVNGTPYKVEMEPTKKKSLTSVKRQIATATASASTKSTPTPAVSKPSAASSAGKKAVKSPLPGVILDIRCAEGEEIKKGQVLMVLEAMKMENNIMSNADGKVTQILVNKGDSVLEGADLVVIE